MAIALSVASNIRIGIKGTPYLPSPRLTLESEQRAAVFADEAEASATAAAGSAADAAASAAGLSAALGAEYITSAATGALSAERVLTDTASVAWDFSTTAQAKANVPDNAVSNAKLRDSAALSVIGRSANSTGDPADIAAGTDGFVLRRSGTTLDFGTVATAGIANDAVDNTKAANMAQNTIKGRVTASTGDPEDLTAAQVRAITTAPGVVRQSRLTLSSTAQGWTGIPANTFRIDIGIVGLSTNGTSNPIIQLGTSSGYETSSYSGATIYTLAATTETGVNYSSGFLVTSVMAATMFWVAQVTLLLDDAASNTWTFAVNGGRSDNTATSDGAGSKSLAATLDRVRITTAGGADTFDAGTISAVCWYT